MKMILNIIEVPADKRYYMGGIGAFDVHMYLQSSNR